MDMSVHLREGVLICAPYTDIIVSKIGAEAALSPTYIFHVTLMKSIDESKLRLGQSCYPLLRNDAVSFGVEVARGMRSVFVVHGEHTVDVQKSN